MKKLLLFLLAVLALSCNSITPTADALAETPVEVEIPMSVLSCEGLIGQWLTDNKLRQADTIIVTETSVIGMTNQKSNTLFAIVSAPEGITQLRVMDGEITVDQKIGCVSDTSKTTSIFYSGKITRENI